MGKLVVKVSPTENERTWVAPSFLSVEISSSSAWNKAIDEANAGKLARYAMMKIIKLRMT